MGVSVSAAQRRLEAQEEGDPWYDVTKVYHDASPCALQSVADCHSEWVACELL